MGSGEAGVEATSMLKMGSLSSSNKEPVFTVHWGYVLLGLTIVAKFSSVNFNGLSGVDRSSRNVNIVVLSY